MAHVKRVIKLRCLPVLRNNVPPIKNLNARLFRDARNARPWIESYSQAARVGAFIERPLNCLFGINIKQIQNIATFLLLANPQNATPGMYLLHKRCFELP